MIVSVLNGLLIITFFIMLINILPLRGTVKGDMNNSIIGSQLLSLSNTYAKNLKSSLGTVAKEATKFLTIHPDSKESVPLDIDVSKVQLREDKDSEQQMFILINDERKRAGAPVLKFDESIAKIARLHITDMFD